MNTSMYQIATIMVQEIPTNAEVEEVIVKDENANRKEENEDYKANNELDHKINQNNAIHVNLLHIITIVAASSVCLLPQLMIPRHNPIYYPEYKNETIVVLLMVCFTYTLRRMMECFAFTKERQLITVSVGLKIFLLHSVYHVLEFGHLYTIFGHQDWDIIILCHLPGYLISLEQC